MDRRKHLVCGRPQTKVNESQTIKKSSGMTGRDPGIGPRTKKWTKNRTEFWKMIRNYRNSKSAWSSMFEDAVLSGGRKIFAFVDAGATTSFVDLEWVQTRGYDYHPKERERSYSSWMEVNCQDLDAVEALTLENGNRIIKVDLEVAKLSGEEDMVIGMDLFEPLGFELLGVPFTWPSQVPL